MTLYKAYCIKIAEEAIQSVSRKHFGSYGPGGTDFDALQGWLLKFEEDSSRLFTSVETFFNWLANGSPPWVAYHTFMSVRLIAIDKQPRVCPVGVGEMWWRLFSKIVLKVNGLEATMACQDGQVCAGPKAVIDGVIHRVQPLWDKN